MALGSFYSKEDRVSLILVGLFALTFIAVFYPTWQSLFKSWMSSDQNSHGFLIVPLSIYFVWRKRKDLKSADIRPSWVAFPLVLFSLFVYLVAQYAEILTLKPLAMIFFIGSSIFFIFGIFVLKICLFPLFFLLFMIPVPAQIYSSLAVPLQLFVSKIAVALASLCGIPITNEGNVIYLPRHTLQMIQACSGLRSIMSLLTLGLVIGYFSMKNNFLRIISTLFAIPIAIFVNILRVLFVIFAFYYMGYDLTRGTGHTALGIIIFILAGLMFACFVKLIKLCQK